MVAAFALSVWVLILLYFGQNNTIPFCDLKTLKCAFKFIGIFQANDNGDYFPMLGICLGFQLLTVLVTGVDQLTACDGENMSLKLSMLPGLDQYHYVQYLQ